MNASSMHKYRSHPILMKRHHILIYRSTERHFFLIKQVHGVGKLNQLNTSVSKETPIFNLINLSNDGANWFTLKNTSMNVCNFIWNMLYFVFSKDVKEVMNESNRFIILFSWKYFFWDKKSWSKWFFMDL